MKAAVFKGAGRPLIIEHRPDPAPGEGEVVIEVGRCGICSTDLHMTAGHDVSFPVDAILGHEYAGRVVDLGPGVNTLKVGDRITAMPMAGCGTCVECARGFPLGCSSMKSMMSGFAEYAVAAERSAVKLPQSLSLSDGALIEPLASSLHGVAMAGIRPGSRVAVIGAGMIGLGAIFWANRMGATRIVAVARTRRHEELAMRLGATRFLLQGENLAGRVASALGGAQPEIAFECIGAHGSLAVAADVVAARGTVIVLGQCLVADSVTPFTAGLKSLVMRFSAAYELTDLEAAADAMDHGALEPRAMVSETITLRELPDVFEQMRRMGRGCKILVNPSTDRLPLRT